MVPELPLVSHCVAPSTASTPRLLAVHAAHACTTNNTQPYRLLLHEFSHAREYSFVGVADDRFGVTLNSLEDVAELFLLGFATRVKTAVHSMLKWAYSCAEIPHVHASSTLYGFGLVCRAHVPMSIRSDENHDCQSNSTYT